jgi:hypothetical protein
MSIMVAGINYDGDETSAEALRREIVARAQRAYDRSLRLRWLVFAASLTFSLGQTVCSVVMPAGSVFLADDGIVWGIPLFASLLAMSLVWSCRLHRDHSQQQYAAYLRKTGRLAS